MAGAVLTELLRRLRQALLLAGSNVHLGAVLEQLLRYGETDAATAARHQGCLPRKNSFFEHNCRLFFGVKLDKFR